MLIFLPGFLAPRGSYDELLEPVVAAGIAVLEPHFVSPLRTALGRYPPEQEAQDTIKWAQGLGAAETADHGMWLAGHSRGGQVAWRVAASHRLPVRGLILIDPVDGAGPRPRAGQAVLDPPSGVPTLIVGAGRSGSCAPAEVNHETFAAALPSATHVVIESMGHADVLSGRAGSWGRRLCPGGQDPAALRQEVSAVMLEWLAPPA